MKLPQYRLLKISSSRKGTSIEAEWVDFVTCAECRKVREDGGHANCSGYLYCKKWKTLVDEDSYCSWGERRE